MLSALFGTKRPRSSSSASQATQQSLDGPSPQRRRTDTPTLVPSSVGPRRVGPPPTVNLATVYPGPGLRLIALLKEWSARLEKASNSGTPDSTSGRDDVVLSGDQVADLTSLLGRAAGELAVQPVTRADLIELLASFAPPNPHTRRTRTKYHNPSRAAAPDLPPEVILLIVEQLREIRMTRNRHSLIGPSGMQKGWEDLRRVSLVNREWHATCNQLWQQERHLTEPRAFPKLLKQFRHSPARQETITKLYIRVYDFTYALGHSDDGFALPDVVRLCKNLSTFSLKGDRSSMPQSPPSMFGRRGTQAVTDFDAYAGGVRLPPLLVAKAASLHHIEYDAPCLLSDLAAFVRMPNLQTLELTGPVMMAAGQMVHLTSCVKSIRRLWLPTSTFHPSAVEALLFNSRVKELALSVDFEDNQSGRTLTGDELRAISSEFIGVIAKVGPNLEEFSLTAKEPQSALHQIQIALGLPGQFFGPFNMPQPQPAPPAQAVAPAQGPQPAQPGAQAAGTNANQIPRIQIRHNQPPFPNLFPPAPGAAGGGAGAGVAPAAPLEPVFDEVVRHLSAKLVSLELVGARYTAALLDTAAARLTGLEKLSLGCPPADAGEREVVVTRLVEEVKRGTWKGLRRVVLGGGGGQWGPVERRRVKEACEGSGVAYASGGTD